MLDEPLSLYLKYPMEMEYWCHRAEEETLDEDLVSQIVGDDQADSELFRQLVIKVYENALTSLQETIIEPLDEKLRALADDYEQLLSRPKRSDWISEYRQWGLRSAGKRGVKAGAWRSAIGIYVGPEKLTDGSSELRILPWVWLRNSEEVGRFLEKAGQKFERSNHPDVGRTIVVAQRGIRLAPDSDAKKIVDEIYENHELAFKHLVSFPNSHK